MRTRRSDKKIYYVNFCPWLLTGCPQGKTFNDCQASDMHLVSYAPQIGFKPFYGNRRQLARPDSLPHLFCKLRQNHNLTKRSLADKFGVSESYVSEIENGSKFPSLNFCLECATEFDINPKYVTNRWAREAIERFSYRLNKRLGLEG